MLCLFSQHFPTCVASLLERSKTLQRSFREETVTDILMASLVALGGGSVIVEFPDEPTTGADMEWNFVNPDDKTSFQILLQAKKVHDKSTDWRRHSYRELFYRSGPSKILQVETLCKAATSRTTANSFATYPIYILYNSTTTLNLTRAGGATNVLGVNLCDGYLIYMFANFARPKSARSTLRTLDCLHPFLFPLTRLFCPSNILPIRPMSFAGSMPAILSFHKGHTTAGQPIPPRPDQIRERIVREQNRVLELFPNEDVDFSLPEVPPVHNTIPDSIQRVLDNSQSPGSFERERLPFWRVTFVSATPRDDLGQPIDRRAD